VNWAQTGLNRLALSLLCLDAIVLIVEISLYFRLGLTVAWTPDAAVAAGMLVLLLGLWLYYHFVPGTAIESFIAEVILVLVMTIVFANLIVLAQYPAVALKSPYADPWLAAADARLGVNVPALARWTARHPAISQVLRLVYFTHVPQFALAVFGLGLLRERETLWEFAFSFHLCLAASVVAFAIWPAACVSAYYRFAPTIDVTRAIEQIQGFHTGSMSVVKLAEMDGLVSFPSFHVAGGLIVTWAFRRHPGFLWPLVVLNIGMAAATVMTGLHYAIDVIAAVPMVMASIALFERWGRGLIRPPRSR
jgi:hypothetical protein